MKELTENLRQNWPTYFFEILVLIIGIYGAFALENWNEERKQKKEEQALYRQLILDYEANLMQLNQKIELHRTCVNSSFFILDAMDNQTADLDSLLIHISVLGIDVTFDPIKNNLSNSGKINLIKNPELNRMITNWSSELAALREIEIMWQGRVYGQFLDMCLDMGIERDSQSKFWEIEGIHADWLLDKEKEESRSVTRSKNSPNLRDILQNKHLEGIVAHGIGMNQGAIEQSLALRKRIEKTLKLLHKELIK